MESKKSRNSQKRLLSEITGIVDKEEYIDVTKTDWYIETKKNIKPGDYVRVYRTNAQMTQAQLGKMLGNFSRQNISEIEKSKRGISKETAKKLSLLFKKPLDKFI